MCLRRLVEPRCGVKIDQYGGRAQQYRYQDDKGSVLSCQSSKIIRGFCIAVCNCLGERVACYGFSSL